MQSPVSPSPSLTSVSSSARGTTRQPPPPRPQKPLHLTVRSKPTTSNHTQWDSQATIKANHTGGGPSTASAAESLYYSPFPSVLHSREPSLLLPDDTGIASAGFAIASTPSSGFLHQHNAHEIAQSMAKTTNLKLINTRLGRRSNNEDDDEDDEDDIEDIDSFLGDDEPQQHLSSLPLSPRRAASPLSAAPSATSSPLSIAAAAAAAAAIAPTASGPAQESGDTSAAPSPNLRRSPTRPRDSGIERFLSEDKENDDLSFNQTIRPHRNEVEHQDPVKPLRHQEQQSRLPKVLKRAPLAAPPSLERILRAEPEPVVAADVVVRKPAENEQEQYVIPPSTDHQEHSLQSIEEHDKHGTSPAPVEVQEDTRPAQMQSMESSAAEGIHEASIGVGSFQHLNGDHQPEADYSRDRYEDGHAVSQEPAHSSEQHDSPPAHIEPQNSDEDQQQQQYEHHQAYEKPYPAREQPRWSLTETSEQHHWQQEQAHDYQEQAHDYHQEYQWQQPSQNEYDQPQQNAQAEQQFQQHHPAQFQQQHRIPSLVATSSAYSLGPPYHINNHLTEPRGPFLHAIDLRPTIPQDQQPAGPASASPSKKAKDASTSAAAASKPGYLASLLSFGGKSFNRYGPFVASGAEDWIMCTEAGAGIEAPPGADLSLQSSQGYDEGDEDEDDSNEIADGSYDTSSTWGRSSTIGRSGKRQAAQRPRESDQQQRRSHMNTDLASLSISELSRSSRRSNTDISHHLVLSGPAGPRWKPRSAPFHVCVHSPVKIKKLNGMHEYTLYTITSTYPPFEVSQKRKKRAAAGEDGAGSEGDPVTDQMQYAMPYDPVLPPHPPGHTLTVTRRYSQFAWLARVLSARYPALVLPPLPSKQYAGRFASEFIETRRADLELWLSRVVRHPICRYEEAVIFFLSEEVEEGAGSSGNGESEWKKKEAELEAVPRMEIVSGIGPNGAYSTIGRKGMPIHMMNANTSKQPPSKGASPNANGTHKPVVVLEGAPTFFASTFHPDFNLDVNDAAAEAKAMEAFSDAYERAMMLEPGGGMGGCMPSSYSAAAGGGGASSSANSSGAGSTGGGGSVSSAAAATSTVGALASAMADSAGPRAAPPRGCPAAGSVGVLPAWRGLRESTALRADSYRDLSFSILRLLTGRGLGLPEDQAGSLSSASMVSLAGKDGDSGSKHMSTASGLGHDNMRGPSVLHRAHVSPATNEEGGWCWREGCTECVALTKSMQYVAQALQHVADEHEDHTRMALMRQHERLKAIGRPRLAVDKLLQVHHSTTAKFREATGERAEDNEGQTAQAQHLTQTERELMAARCETVLNVTMSEMDRIHNERTEDWTAWGKHWLDDEIGHYERCLETLRNARAAFEPDSWEYYAQEGPVARTPHDARLYSTRRSALPIPMPSPPWAPAGMTATALRPVSLASEVVREGVTKFTYLFGGGGSSGGTAGTSLASSVAASPAALPTIRESEQQYFG